jgi:hypothetical protein
MIVLILVPFWLAFWLIRIVGLLLFWTVALLLIVGKLLVTAGKEARQRSLARQAQRWADTHRYPLSLPDLREATPRL